MVDLFDEKDIVNKEYYNGIKDKINCPICLSIIEEPYQCSKCERFFCKNCILSVEKCPFRCENNTYNPSLLCKQLISELKIKCKCGQVVDFDHIRIHKEEQCKNVDYKKSYFNLKKRYESLLKNQSEEANEIKHSYFIKSSVHKHPIEVIRRYLNTWYCNICDKYFKADIPSYHCTLCDFDVCYNCVKDKVTKGTIKEGMEKFY